MIRRAVLLAVLVVTGLALETSVFGSLTLTGTKPELLLLITVALAMGDGPAFGATAGFVFGLATDLVLAQPAGVTALTFTLAGYLVGIVRQSLQRPSAWLPMAMVSATTFAAVLFYGSMSYLLGQAVPSPLRILRHAGLSAVYNALLTPFVYPLIRGVIVRLTPRPAEVIR